MRWVLESLLSFPVFLILFLGMTGLGATLGEASGAYSDAWIRAGFGILFLGMLLWVVVRLKRGKISRKRALQIAREQCQIGDLDVKIRGDVAGGDLNLYQVPDEPFWLLTLGWGDGKDGSMLRSSRLILISKRTGDVLYDGSAQDEG